ncbi:MAG TPA: branched-chain amino acid ABC transporter permease [Candidatus Tectomicrobia bacterium]|jgi:branched-chain amino acid transport system permease protein/neutral amino acid transport system permease protein
MLQLIVYGLISGSIVALGAIGLTLIYGILNFANFAHGDLMALGAYLVLFFRVSLALPMWLSFILGVLCTALLGVCLDRVWFRPLRQRQARAAILAISSLGLALILQNLIRMLWGPQAQYYSRAIHFPFTVPVLQVRLNTQQILIFAIALGLVMLVSLFLQRTKLGKAMRATSDNFSLALVSGIDTELVVILTWLLGAGLAAAGGVLLGMSVRLQPIMGWDLLLPIFAAAILGGIGSPYGAMAGAVIIGLAEELSTPFIPTEYKTAVSLVLLVLVLLVRPRGLFAGWTP